VTNTADEVRVVGLRPEEAALAGAVLARSHQDDPAFSVVYSEPRVRARALSVVFDQWCRDALPFGGVDALHLGGRLVGVAVWLPPGRFPPSLGRQIRFAPDYLPVLRLAPRSFPLLVRFMSRAARLHPPGRKWYLEIVGLDDGFRGRGLGGRLLRRGLARSDEQDLPCYLETAKATNVGWYERLGFSVDVPALQLLPRGPTHWTMWRGRRG